MLSSINGNIAFHANESSAERLQNSFTCPDDFERMQKLVSQCDVVFIGSRSIECELGAFRVAHLKSSQQEPEWIIFTRTGNISFKSPFWKQKNLPKSLFFVSSFNVQEKPIFSIEEKEFNDIQGLNGVRIKCYSGNITGLIQYLKEKNYKKAALLGGGKLNSAFWENNLVNELYLTLSPFLVGGEHLPVLLDTKIPLQKKLILKKCKHKNGFVFLDYFINS